MSNKEIKIQDRGVLFKVQQRLNEYNFNFTIFNNVLIIRKRSRK